MQPALQTTTLTTLVQHVRGPVRMPAFPAVQCSSSVYAVTAVGQVDSKACERPPRL